MKLENLNIDRNSSDILLQIVKNIEAPLATLIEESHKISALYYNKLNRHHSQNIIFSNSQEIKRLIDDVADLIKLKQLSGHEPRIFEIYASNERVQQFCKNEIDANRVSQPDKEWLYKLEQEVLKNVQHRELHLSDLSYRLAVSKRQLHRKIQQLLFLTPNKYIRILKLSKAKHMIDDYLYDTISQVSYAVGYYDTHYFSKLFTQQYGITPKELLAAKGDVHFD